MRHWLTISLLALSVAGPSPCPFAVAQEQQHSENPRKVVNRQVPTYPELARQSNLEGTVRLLVTVAPNGTAKSAKTLGGSPVLIKAAEDAIYKWRWERAPQESEELVEFRFHPN